MAFNYASYRKKKRGLQRRQRAKLNNLLIKLTDTVASLAEKGKKKKKKKKNKE